MLKFSIVILVLCGSAFGGNVNQILTSLVRGLLQS